MIISAPGYAENYAGQALAANDMTLRYWKNDGVQEVELILQDGMNVIPVDVKKVKKVDAILSPTESPERISVLRMESKLSPSMLSSVLKRMGTLNLKTAKYAHAS